MREIIEASLGDFGAVVISAGTWIESRHVNQCRDIKVFRRIWLCGDKDIIALTCTDVESLGCCSLCIDAVHCYNGHVVVFDVEEKGWEGANVHDAEEVRLAGYQSQQRDSGVRSRPYLSPCNSYLGLR